MTCQGGWHSIFNNFPFSCLQRRDNNPPEKEIFPRKFFILKYYDVEYVVTKIFCISLLFLVVCRFCFFLSLSGKDNFFSIGNKLES